MRKFLATMAAGLLLSGVAGGSLLAETITYKAVLSGANEVPANDSAASGEAVAEYDTESRALSWTVSFDGLSGPVIGAHLHGPAAAGANAAVVVPLVVSPPPITGSATLTEEQAGFLESGSIYVNLHTERYPGGELRGNLMRE